MVYATVIFPYGRPQGSLGSLFALHVRRRSLLISSVTALVLAGLLGGWFGLASLALTWLVMIAIARWTMTRIPGLTGDVYGAINELTELAMLLLATAWPAS
jgi:adenosylcobinamide-GDP ribazoletransferase